MKKFFRLGKYHQDEDTRHYAEFFNLYKIDAEYTSLLCTSLKENIDYILELDASGFTVDIPFKNEIIYYLDSMDSLVHEYDICNTVIVSDGKLIGFNTDYYGAVAISKHIRSDQKVIILGFGAMGKMFSSILPFADIYCREFGNWGDRHQFVDIIINCTTLGSISNESPLEYIPETVTHVIDLSMQDNKLMELCVGSNTQYTSGKEFYKQQFLRQFEIYTGYNTLVDTI